MATTISVTEQKWSRGSYEIQVKRPRQKHNGYYGHIHGVEEAAAKAVEIANAVDGEYVIYAPKKVKEEIKNGGLRGFNG